MESQQSSAVQAMWKVATAWLLVALSHVETWANNVDWLRFWQIGAAIGAAVFTAINTWVLIRDKLINRRTRR